MTFNFKFAMQLICTLVIALTFHQTALASACCGGSFFLPSLISNGNNTQVIVNQSFSETHATVQTDGQWARPNKQENIVTTKIEASHKFNPQYQMGLSIPIIQNHSGSQHSSPLGGDLSLSAGFQPEFGDYYPLQTWLLFTSITAPTGKSFYDGGDPITWTGRGFYTASVGTLLTSVHQKWDEQIVIEIHNGLGRRFNVDETSTTWTPSLGGSVQTGLGFNQGPWRIGANIGASYDGPVGSSDGTFRPLQRVFPLSGSCGYFSAKNWSGSISYVDQTLIGEPANVNLSRVWSIALRKAWD